MVRPSGEIAPGMLTNSPADAKTTMPHTLGHRIRPKPANGDFAQQSCGATGLEPQPHLYPGSYVEYVERTGHEAPGVHG
jgi:hypothetical protein